MGFADVPKPIRGSLFRLTRDRAIEFQLQFQFNPSEVRRTIAAGWKLNTAPGGTRPVPMWGAGEGEQVQFELLLFDYEGGPDVRGQLAFLEGLAQPADILVDRTQFQAAPVCLLELGPRFWYVVVENVQVAELQFKSDLSPTRATVRLVMSGIYAGDSDERGRLSDLWSDSARASNVVYGGG